MKSSSKTSTDEIVASIKEKSNEVFETFVKVLRHLFFFMKICDMIPGAKGHAFHDMLLRLDKKRGLQKGKEVNDMKKKVVALLLSTVLVMTLGGCGSNAENAADSTEEPIESTETAGEPSASGAFDLNAADYVTLCDYESIAVTISDEFEMSDEALDTYIASWMEYAGPFYKEVEGRTVIEEGDIVKLDYVGKLDGVAFDGGTAKDQLIDVYKNASADGTTYIDGFTDGIKGAAVGDVVDCDVTFPENYGNEDLAGKDVVFTFTIHSIQEPMSFADFDDAYVSENFDVENVTELTNQLKEALTNQLEYYRWYEISNQVQSYLQDNCTVEVPEDYLAARVTDYRRQFIDYYCGGDEEQLDEVAGTYFGNTAEELEESWKDDQRSGIELELILGAIAAELEISVDEEEYGDYVEDMVSSGGYESAAALYELYGYGDAEYGERYLRDIYLCNLALEQLTKKADVTVDASLAAEQEAAEGEEAVLSTETE